MQLWCLNGCCILICASKKKHVTGNTRCLLTLKGIWCSWKNLLSWKVQSASYCLSDSIGWLLFSAYIYSHGIGAAFHPPIGQVKANTKVFANTIWPWSDFFPYSSPAPAVWANPSLQYVSSFFLSCSSGFFFAHPAWPCNSAWTIWRCLLQPLFLRSSAFSHVLPAVFVRNTVCQCLGKGEEWGERNRTP